MISTTISRYRFLEKLGQGSMSVLYMAVDANPGHFLAANVPSVSNCRRMSKYDS